MSCTGRQPVQVPSGVEMTIDGRHVTVRGSKGTLEHTAVEPIAVSSDDGLISVTRPDDERKLRSLHGLIRTFIDDMVVGVTQGYSKVMEVVGTGYRAVAKRSNLEFSLGYSHTVITSAPGGIIFTVESPTKFSVNGINKQQVGEAAVNIRKLRKLEPHKGKGVRYAGENVYHKVGRAGR